MTDPLGIEALRRDVAETRQLVRQLVGAIADERPEYYTISQAADALGVSRQTVHNRAKAGSLRITSKGVPREYIPRGFNPAS